MGEEEVEPKVQASELGGNLINALRREKSARNDARNDEERLRAEEALVGLAAEVREVGPAMVEKDLRARLRHYLVETDRRLRENREAVINTAKNFKPKATWREFYELSDGENRLLDDISDGELHAILGAIFFCKGVASTTVTRPAVSPSGS